MVNRPSGRPEGRKPPIVAPSSLQSRCDAVGNRCPGKSAERARIHNNPVQSLSSGPRPVRAVDQVEVDSQKFLDEQGGGREGGEGRDDLQAAAAEVAKGEMAALPLPLEEPGMERPM